MGTFAKNVIFTYGELTHEDFGVVDTGSDYICLPSSIAQKLAIDEQSLPKITIAGVDEDIDCPFIATGLVMEYGGFPISVNAIITGDEVLLGTIWMEALHLQVDPNRGTLRPPKNSAQFRFIQEPKTKWLRKP